MNTRRNKDKGLDLDTNKFITPMLDMTFQLLFFFVLFYNPSTLEGQMDLSLPADADKAAHKKEDVKPDAKSEKDLTLEVPSDLTVIVRTQQDGVNNGIISALTVEESAGPKAIEGGLDGLRKYLQEARKAVANKSALKLKGDGRLKWRAVVEVMDVCRQAGFENISFVPPPDLNLSGQ
jgi:biopolymer transport protein ExbD